MIDQGSWARGLDRIRLAVDLQPVREPLRLAVVERQHTPAGTELWPPGLEAGRSAGHKDGRGPSVTAWHFSEMTRSIVRSITVGSSRDFFTCGNVWDCGGVEQATLAGCWCTAFGGLARGGCAVVFSEETLRIKLKFVSVPVDIDTGQGYLIPSCLDSICSWRRSCLEAWNNTDYTDNWYQCLDRICCWRLPFVVACWSNLLQEYF